MIFFALSCFLSLRSLTLRFPFCVYCFPQILQENGFSPVCVTRCRFMVVTQTNRLPHTPHTGRILEERFLVPVGGKGKRNVLLQSFRGKWYVGHR